MGYSYDRRVAKKTLDLAQEGLAGLAEGRPTKLYHGATRLFRKFDLSLSRGELVDRYYGKGIFLTPSKRVATQYAEANRNIGFDPSIIAKLKSRNPGAGALLQSIYDKGQEEGWDSWAQESGIVQADGTWDNAVMDKVLGGIDGNDLTDIAQYTVGSKVGPSGSDPVNIFDQSSGAPDWIYDSLDNVGIDSKEYRPKVYTVIVTVSNPLVTARKAQARSARKKGYDAVIFHGSNLVGGVPEVAVFDPKDARVQGYEIV